jgi:hypothetical protein
LRSAVVRRCPVLLNRNRSGDGSACTAPHRSATRCDAMQHGATQCNAVRRNATRCDAMQHVAMQRTRHVAAQRSLLSQRCCRISQAVRRRLSRPRFVWFQPQTSNARTPNCARAKPGRGPSGSIRVLKPINAPICFRSKPRRRSSGSSRQAQPHCSPRYGRGTSPYRRDTAGVPTVAGRAAGTGTQGANRRALDCFELFVPGVR